VIAAPPVISADHVSKWYGQVSALNDVSARVPPGITGLLGPSGAGKSTFMKLMTGQLRPSTGVVRVLGEPANDNPGIYSRIGFCPEQDAFYETMTGFEWVSTLVGLHGLTPTAAREATERAIEAVGLTDVAGRKIGAYSRGMRQRVKLAQAIAHEPELLILDEPLAGMDPIGRRTTMQMVREWARGGRSVVLSSHMLHEVEAMTGNILLMNQGRILADGDVRQIRSLIDTHPHRVFIKARDPGALARRLLLDSDVISLRFDGDAVTIETARPGELYDWVTERAAEGDCGDIEELSSPDDNLQAVFNYLVKA